MTYRIVLSNDARDYLGHLPKKLQRQLGNHIDTLAERPFDHKLLKGKPYRTLRSGDYRVLYQVDRGAGTVYVATIGDRRDVYGDC